MDFTNRPNALELPRFIESGNNESLVKTHGIISNHSSAIIERIKESNRSNEANTINNKTSESGLIKPEDASLNGDKSDKLSNETDETHSKNGNPFLLSESASAAFSEMLTNTGCNAWSHVINKLNFYQETPIELSPQETVPVSLNKGKNDYDDNFKVEKSSIDKSSNVDQISRAKSSSNLANENDSQLSQQTTLVNTPGISKPHKLWSPWRLLNDNDGNTQQTSKSQKNDNSSEASTIKPNTFLTTENSQNGTSTLRNELQLNNVSNMKRKRTGRCEETTPAKVRKTLETEENTNPSSPNDDDNSGKEQVNEELLKISPEKMDYDYAARLFKILSYQSPVEAPVHKTWTPWNPINDMNSTTKQPKEPHLSNYTRENTNEDFQGKSLDVNPSCTTPVKTKESPKIWNPWNLVNDMNGGTNHLNKPHLNHFIGNMTYAHNQATAHVKVPNPKESQEKWKPWNPFMTSEPKQQNEPHLKNIPQMLTNDRYKYKPIDYRISLPSLTPPLDLSKTSKFNENSTRSVPVNADASNYLRDSTNLMSNAQSEKSINPQSINDKSAYFYNNHKTMADSIKNSEANQHNASNHLKDSTNMMSNDQSRKLTLINTQLMDDRLASSMQPLRVIIPERKLQRIPGLSILQANGVYLMKSYVPNQSKRTGLLMITNNQLQHQGVTTLIKPTTTPTISHNQNLPSTSNSQQNAVPFTHFMSDGSTLLINGKNSETILPGPHVLDATGPTEAQDEMPSYLLKPDNVEVCPRKPRTVFTKTQLAGLELALKKHGGSLQGKVTMQVGYELGLDPTVVRTWFTNQKAKLARAVKKE